MRFSHLAASTAAYLLAQSASIVSSNVPRATSLQSSGYSDVVQWDNYSLFVRGQRIFVWSGEFHSWRLPVPDLWPDIFQKMKAAGFNAVSIYVHWGTISPSRNIIDLDGYRDLKPVFEAAKEAGIFLIYRPGPYINAETSAGGIPHWVTTEVAGHLRTNASDYAAAWAPYVKAISEAVKGYQVSEGGPVVAIQVENEYPQAEDLGNPGKAGMMADLEAAFRKYGVVVPTTFNDPSMGANYVTGLGKVDLYGLDSYSNGFDCRNQTYRAPVVENYYSYHMSTNPKTPHFIPEFQSGSLDPWGPEAPGLDACYNLTGPDYLMFNAYMLYGGTSWGHLPFHKGYNGAAIRENRRLSTKYTEFKKQGLSQHPSLVDIETTTDYCFPGLFLRNAPEFYKTDVVGNSSSGAVTVSDSAAFVTELRNPDSNAGFYVARQTYSPSAANLVFNLTVKASAGSLPVQVTLAGRQSKVIVTDFAFGSSRALYSTATVFYAGKLGGRDVLVLQGDVGVQHTAAVKFTSSASVSGNKAVTTASGPAEYTIVTFKPTTEGFTAVSSGSTGPLVLFATSGTIATLWQPAVSSSTGNYWAFDTNSTLLVSGPYLVRSAEIKDNTVALTGDLDEDTTAYVYGAPKGAKLTWNGKSVSTSASTAIDGFIEGRLTISKGQVNVPTLSNWKYVDRQVWMVCMHLPEIATSYDDSAWVVANHTTTNSPYKPYYGDGRVLHGCDYGFCEGPVFWRGQFTATGTEKSVNLSINGGEAFAASVWLNGKFIKTTYGRSTYPAYIWPILSPAIEETDEVYTFPKGSLVAGKNVVTILQDNMGMNETNDWNADTSKSPRGIRGFQLSDGAKFGAWKVQGKLGGYTNFPDKARGIVNEGGLYAERAGWHLPGFNTQSWTSRALNQGLPSGKAGVGFFRTEFSLDIPTGRDVHLSFVFGDKKQPYRATLFVNGWTMGRVISNWGTVAVALWVLEDEPVQPTLSLVVDGSYEGGVGKIALNNPVWTSRGRVV
ncbi:hypothetical protein FRC10_008085 [Ceratobasidium sp. 414]|nr:hypothetical protein FRC10_008085 [Ceratobasidium sp. 414]